MVQWRRPEGVGLLISMAGRLIQRIGRIALRRRPEVTSAEEHAQLEGHVEAGAMR